ncbi:chromosomal replication initiation ATPase DnaA [Paenochrobactrum gallinarii]|uniref:Chromosomal replication initiation ATPase DnaA n=1 Tax=Paenochrobactrum gallinarii TaxID=643673 RepID=A0A841LSU1_9HYPH|nr:helix-turn-helix domain-containing protein [Paenochrobactrum gallinarii]MBB6260336.1 chromosomal replication initiation ATPase DnaA [Paenochrobactrum gallinarii]
MSFQISGVIRVQAEAYQALEMIAARQIRPVRLDNLKKRSTRFKKNALEICDGVLDLLSDAFGVCGSELRNSVRGTKEIARIRQIGMYVAHTMFSMPMTTVALGFGRDRSTVMYACHQIENLRDDEEFDQIVLSFERIVATAFAMQRRAK